MYTATLLINDEPQEVFIDDLAEVIDKDNPEFDSLEENEDEYEEETDEEFDDGGMFPNPDDDPEDNDMTSFIEYCNNHFD